MFVAIAKDIPFGTERVRTIMVKETFMVGLHLSSLIICHTQPNTLLKYLLQKIALNSIEAILIDGKRRNP